ncbi:DUF6924 domain-containing protein [Streptomyces sp. NBC_00250]|uniref:DUF6924 domain-containing protein n=1 Tax=Streptomyces sp. NBC_00250 TaxID=2903641 RepID=UPI003FA7E787
MWADSGVSSHVRSRWCRIRNILFARLNGYDAILHPHQPRLHPHPISRGFRRADVTDITHSTSVALTNIWEDEGDLDPLYYQELIESPEPREFRAAPAAVHDVHANLTLGNMDFAEVAAAASAASDQALRPV